MRIGFDGKRAVQNFTGLGNYSRYIVDILCQFYPENEYVLYAPKKRENKRLNKLTKQYRQLQLSYPTTSFWKKLSSLWRVLGVTRQLEKERIDNLGINGYQIIQKEQGFCFGMDAVLLSDFAQVKNGGRVLDLGTGTGILPILMEAKTKAVHLTGLEIQPEMAEMAARSVKLNHLEDKIEIVEGDIKEASAIFSHDSFDTITSNPPYMIGQHGLKNPSETKAIARHEILCTFADITAAAKKLLKNKGKLFLVHRTFRLSEILCQLSKDGLEPKRIRFVHPYIDKEPNIFLLEAVKGGKSRMTVEPPLIVYQKEGKYTEEIYKIYGMNPEE